MSDVLFDWGRFFLKAGDREKLVTLVMQESLGKLDLVMKSSHHAGGTGRRLSLSLRIDLFRPVLVFVL